MVEITERLRRVAHGLQLTFVALAMFGAALAILTVGVASHWREALRLLHGRLDWPTESLVSRSGPLAMIVVSVNAIALAGSFLCAVGHQLCFATPEEVPGRRPLRAAFVLQVATMLHMLWDLLARFDLAPPVPPPVSWAVTAGWIVALGLLWLYLRPLSRYIRRKDIKQDTRSFLDVYRRPELAGLGVLAAVVCVVAAVNGLVPWVGAGLAFGAVVLAAFLVRFGWLLRQVQLGTITFAELLVPRGGV